jgi:hypothetical protein
MQHRPTPTPQQRGRFINTSRNNSGLSRHFRILFCRMRNRWVSNLTTIAARSRSLGPETDEPNRRDRPVQVAALSDEKQIGAIQSTVGIGAHGNE